MTGVTLVRYKTRILPNHVQTKPAGPSDRREIRLVSNKDYLICGTPRVIRSGITAPAEMIIAIAWSAGMWLGVSRLTGRSCRYPVVGFTAVGT